MMRRIAFALFAAALFASLSTAVLAQMGITFFPGPGTPASSGGRTCTDDTASTNFLARTSGLNNTHKDAYCNFIKTMESNSLITGNLSGASSCGTLFDAIYLTATSTTGNAALNICGTSYSLVAHGSPTFTADSGYVGASSSYLDTQFNPITATSPNYVQNSANISFWSLTNFVSSTDYGSAMGTDGSFFIRLYPHFSSNTFFGSANGPQGTATSGQPGHFYSVSRTAAAVQNLYIDTTATSGTPTSNAPNSVDILLLADDNSGLNPFQGNLSFAAIGAGLNSTQEGNFRAAVHTYMQTIAGAP